MATKLKNSYYFIFVCRAIRKKMNVNTWDSLWDVSIIGRCSYIIWYILLLHSYVVYREIMLASSTNIWQIL